MDPLIADLLPAVEQQLLSPETRYVKEAHERLVTHSTEEITSDEAKAMIAFCLADEIDQMETAKRPFDAARYQMLLQLLPTMPEAQ